MEYGGFPVWVDVTTERIIHLDINVFIKISYKANHKYLAKNLN